ITQPQHDIGSAGDRQQLAPLPQRERSQIKKAADRRPVQNKQIDQKGRNRQPTEATIAGQWSRFAIGQGAQQRGQTQQDKQRKQQRPLGRLIILPDTVGQPEQEQSGRSDDDAGAEREGADLTQKIRSRGGGGALAAEHDKEGWHADGEEVQER